MEALLLVGVVAALVWAVVLVRYGCPLTGCLTYIVLVALFDARFYSLPVAGLTLTVNRVAWGVLLLAYVIWWRLGWTERKRLATADVVLIALLSVLTLSIFTHDWTVDKAWGFWRFLGAFLIPASLFWIARQSPPSQRGMARLRAGVIALALYLAVTAIAEVAGAWWLVFPSHVAWHHDNFWMFYGRGRGPMHFPMADGFFQSIGLYAAVTWWPALRRRGRSLLTAGIVVLAAGIASTLTRSVWIGSVAGLAVILPLALTAGWRWRAAGLASLATALVMAVLLTGGWEKVLRLERDKDLTAEAAEESVEMRSQFSAMACRMFRDRPVFGCGFGQYGQTLLDDYSDRSLDVNVEKLRQYTQHNVFLSLLVESGLVGVGLYVLLLGCWARDAWHLWRSNEKPLWARQMGLVFLGVMTSYLVNAMFHDLTQDNFTHIMLFALAGAVAALVRSPVRATYPAAATATSPILTFPLQKAKSL